MAPSGRAASPTWRECRVELPAAQNWIVLDLSANDPETWAMSVAEEHLGPDAAADWVRAFSQDLIWYWTAAVRQRALCAALLTPPLHSVIASYSVRELHISSEWRNMASLRAEAERTEGPYFGTPVITEVELPQGPALRVQRMEPTDPASATGSVVEGVAHYVLPRAHSSALECRLLWSSLGLGKELNKVADELAASLRLV